MHAAEDHKRRETVEARNNLDGLIYRVEKNLTEVGSEVPEDAVRDVKEAVEKAKTALDSDDADTIKSATGALEQSSHKLAEALYKKAQSEQHDAGGAEAGGAGPAGNGGRPGQGGGDDNVVDLRISNR